MQKVGLKRLVSQVPQAPVVPYHLGGISFHSSPVVSSEGKLLLAWRGVSGNAVGEDGEGDPNTLVESVQLHRLEGDGSAVFGPAPRVISQGVYSILDDAGIPGGGGTVGFVPDPTGGFYYLWGLFVLRFDGEGRALWPEGKLKRDQTHPIWKFPSAVRFTQNVASDVQLVTAFVNDGTQAPDAGVLVFWTDAPKADGAPMFRAQRIDASGQLRWGEKGVSLLNGGDFPLFVHAVATGDGGFLTVIPADASGDQTRVEFYSPDGKKRAQTDSFEFSLVQSETSFVESDGAGGVYLVYFKPGTDEEGNARKEVHLTRIDASGTRVFDQVLECPAGLLSNFVLKRTPQGDCVVAWRWFPAAYDLDQADPQARVFVSRVSASGQPVGSRTVTQLVLPGVVGEFHRENNEGRIALEATEQATFVGFESLVAVPQAVAESGARFHWVVQRLPVQGAVTPETWDCAWATGGASSLFQWQGHLGVVTFREELFKTREKEIAIPVPYFGFLPGAES